MTYYDSVRRIRKFFNYVTLTFMLLLTIFICIGLLMALNLNFRLPFPFLTKADDFVAFQHYGTEWFRVMTKEQNMTLNIPLKYIPQNTAMNVYVLKAAVPDKENVELFGISGLQGVPDQMPAQIDTINTRLNQSMPVANSTELLERSFAMAALSGVRYVSLDFSWVDVQAMTGKDGKHQFDFTLFDRVFDAAKRYNISLIPILAYSPPYARQTPSPYDRRCLPADTTSSGSAVFNEFAAAVVGRYRPAGGTYPGVTDKYGIRDWIIWNEPNSDSMKDCDSAFPDALSAYAALFKGAYTAIHGLDADNKSGLNVIMAGLVSPSAASSDPKQAASFLTGFFGKLGDSHKPDTLNLHYFNTSSDPGNGSSVGELRTVLDSFITARDRAGASDIPIWITQIGRDYDKSNTGVSTAFMDNAFDLIKKNYAGAKKVNRVLWWSGEGRLYRVSPTQFIENASEEMKSLIDYDFSPRETYFRFAENWLHGFTRTDRITGLYAGSDMVTVSLTAKQLPNMNNEYALLTEAPNQKAALQLPYIVSLESVIQPNCRNVSGPTTVRLGESGTYSANFISRQKNLIGQFFYDNGDRVMNNLGKENLPGSEATYSVTWSPGAAGTYNICCSAWNGDYGHCTPDGYNFGSTACAGPDTCIKVVVPPRTPSNMKLPGGGTVAGLSLTYVEKWQKYIQSILMRTSSGTSVFTQKIPKNNDGSPDWDSAEPWIRSGSGMPANPHENSLTDPANMIQVVFYPEGLRERLGSVRVDGTVSWGDLRFSSTYPAAGSPQTITGETFTNPKDGSSTYFQAIWMNDKEYFRSGPVDPQTHLPSLPSSWNGPNSLAGLPPNDTAGSIQAHDITLLPDPGNIVLERISRANTIYWRMVPLNGDGMPDWEHASGWMLH